MDYKVSEIKLSPEVAGQKIRNWCAYQERSHHETRQKLFGYGLTSEEVEGIIADLIQENFLNEERFAIALAGGKFRIKHWGRIKIKIDLKRHKVSEVNINKALKSIQEEDYTAMIIKIIEKKLESASHLQFQKRYYSALNYLISRGFESDLVKDQLKNYK